MSIFYGSDTTCLTDLPLIDTQIDDPVQLIGQRIARRLQVPRGALGLISDDPTFGYDVRQLVNARLAPGDIANAQQTIKDECLKDQQVEDCSVKITANTAGAVTIAVNLVASSGPFVLTLNVTALTVEAVFSF
jgi:hypothetical protein